MKKILLIALFFITLGQLYAKEFTAGGMEPFWSLSLKQQHGDQYQAVLSYPDETGTTTVKATVERFDHKAYTIYKGKGSNGKPLSIITIEKSCVNEGKGDISSYTVDVQGYFEGCGDFEDNQQTALEKAKKLNTKGYHLYKEGRYKEALFLFQHARETDPGYVLGHYNFACTAALIMQKNKCITEGNLINLTSEDMVINALKQSIKLDPKRKAKMQTDPDLAELRKTYEYYRYVLGYSPKNNHQLKEILQKLEWTQAVGFYPHHGKPAGIQFDGNRVIVTDNGGNRTIGTYKTHNGSIIVTIKGKTITGELIEDSELGLTLLQFTGKVLPINDFVTKIRFDNTSGCSD